MEGVDYCSSCRQPHRVSNCSSLGSSGHPLFYSTRSIQVARKTIISRRRRPSDRRNIRCASNCNKLSRSRVLLGFGYFRLHVEHCAVQPQARTGSISKYQNFGIDTINHRRIEGLCRWDHYPKRRSARVRRTKESSADAHRCRRAIAYHGVGNELL